jgi:hypothetical protein
MKASNKLLIGTSIFVVLALTCTALAGYTVHTPITDVSITSHNDYDSVYVGQEYTLTCTTSTDKDCHNGSHTHSDPVVHTWSGPGTFNPTTGTSVTWIPPETSGNKTITVTASDDGNPVLADDTDKTDSVILTVENTLYYVDVDAAGSDDGTSWTDAFNYLQDAFDAVSSGDEIWVAEGTYYPDDGDSVTDGNRSETFQLVDGVEVYGGFDATETARSQRCWANNETILSGDIDKDGLLYEYDNAYHVVKGADNAVLDGFTITYGSANGLDVNDVLGGGMFNDAVSPTVNHCVFSDNMAAWGGAMMNRNGSDLTISNCVFTRNKIFYNGSAVMNYISSSPTLINCTFTNNWSMAGAGGAIRNNDNCDPELTNCVFWNDEAEAGSDEVSNTDNSDPNFSYCDVEGCGGSGGGWDSSFGIDGGGNIDTDPGFVNNFDFWRLTNGPGTTTTIKVPDASLYSVDDEIEYDDDGVLRKVTAVNTTTDIVSFADDALGSASVAAKAIFNWGSGATDPNEDLHLTSNSACVEAGDQNGTYTGQKDIDCDDRVIDGDDDTEDEVDIGADEYNPS